MPLSCEVRSLYRFGVFELDAHTGELRRNGIKLKLQDQPYQVLLKLLEHAGQTVAREQLRTALWPADTFVGFETGLNTTIKRLRETLGGFGRESHVHRNASQTGISVHCTCDRTGSRVRVGCRKRRSGKSPAKHHLRTRCRPDSGGIVGRLCFAPLESRAIFACSGIGLYSAHERQPSKAGTPPERWFPDRFFRGPACRADPSGCRRGPPDPSITWSPLMQCGVSERRPFSIATGTISSS